MRVLIACVLAIGLAGGAHAQGLEYRIEKQTGRPFDLSDGKTKFFHELPFMTAKDFAKATAVAAKNPNTPGAYNVEIAHSAAGKLKFRAVADADRERTYCVIFREIVRGCAAFAPSAKDIYNGSIVFNLPKTEAEALAREINVSLK